MNYLIKKIKNILVKTDQLLAKFYFVKLQGAEKLFHYDKKPFIDCSTTNFSKEVKKSFEFYNNIPQTTYAYILNGEFWIEPQSGWIFDKNKKSVFEYSFPYKELSKPISFFNIKLKKYKKVEFKKVILIRYYFFNYWHFINDVLGQISLIDTFNSDRSIPILVPKGSMSISYVKNMIERSEHLRSRNWKEIPLDTMVVAENIITVKNMPNTKLNFLQAFNLLEYKNSAQGNTSGRKIFMTRAQNIKRSLSNGLEIETVMKQFGFEIIDNNKFNFEQQLAIYGEASVVVGIHGAGLTNLMFRYPLTLKFIELFPSDQIPPHYYWLCDQLGFEYDCIVGSPIVNDQFFVDPMMIVEKFKSISINKS